MGYNIDRIKVISSDSFGVFVCDLGLTPEEAPCDWEGLGDDFYWQTDGVGFATLKTDMFPWRGEGSGSQFDTLLEKVLPRFKGRADMVLIWAGGDSISGLRVVDGVVTRQVVQALGGQE